MKKLKWLIAHEPKHLFERTAEAFAKEVARLTGGEIVIEPISADEFQETNPDFNEKSGGSVFDALEKGMVQMSQTQVNQFGRYDPNYYVFDMPFLFRDHDHATKVFEGPIGQVMNERLAAKSHMRGLAFTYSGGFRVIGSNDPISSAEELVGKRVRVNSNPVNSDFMSSVGADPRRVFTYGYDEIKNGELDAAETTYIRFLGKHILKTHHNMFLTTIVISNELWNSLDAEEQKVFQAAAQVAARLERQWSVEDAENFEKNCVQNGVTITDVSEEDRAKLMEIGQSVHEKWNDYFMPGLLDEIKKVH